MPKYKKGQPWDKPKTKEMLAFENETGKNAIYRDAITGSFEYWLWMEDKRSKGLVRKKRGTAKPVPRRKVEVEVTYVKFTPRQLELLTEKHKNKLISWDKQGKKDYKAYRQINIYLRKLEISSGNITQGYKEKIIEIFDIHKVPYNKKYVVKRIELR